MVRSPPRMPPDLPGRQLLVGQERCEGSLQGVGVAADGVTRVAVVGAPTVEAHVVRRGYEERLE